MISIKSILASILITLLIFLPQYALSQSPEKMSYQTVIRNSVGDLVSESQVGIQISILQGTSEGTAVYVETHLPSTNLNGLTTLEIGMGTPVTGVFGDIEWKNGPFFIRTEADPDGGTTYTLTGVSELLSVPYAFYAEKAGNETFFTSDSITSNALGDFAINDFVFGSPVLNDDGISEHGSRLYFDKSKSAFRAGVSSFGAWDDENVGYASIALGEATMANGVNSTALGLSTTANGDQSVAMGSGATASGEYSFASGLFSTANGESSIALGSGATAGADHTIAIGEATSAIGHHATSIGWSNMASGFISTALGYSTIASSSSATAMGGFTTASGQYATAMGYYTIADGERSSASGHYTTARSHAEFVIGSYNTAYEQTSTQVWSPLDRLFVVGNGQFDSPSDAIVVLKNGNTGLGTSTPNELLEVGGDGRAFFGDGEGDNRKGLLLDGIQGDGASRIEAFNYGSLTGMDLVLNTTPSAGNVGIYTNNPTARLSVNGSANKPGGGSWSVFSDRRLKKDIGSYEDGLSEILAINPVTFRYNGISKADTVSQFVGVIAQELEKISPYMINTIVIDDTDYLEVNNSAMTYMLINAVKEQQVIIENLQAKNSDLKTLNKNQDLRINELDAKLQVNTELLQELNDILKTVAKQ